MRRSFPTIDTLYGGTWFDGKKRIGSRSGVKKGGMLFNQGKNISYKDSSREPAYPGIGGVSVRIILRFR